LPSGFKRFINSLKGHHDHQYDPAKFSDQKIPRLATVLKNYPHTPLYVELKNKNWQVGSKSGGNLEEHFAEVIQKQNAYDRVMAISFSKKSLRKIKGLDLKIETGYITFLGGLMTKMPTQVLRWYLEKRVKQKIGADALLLPHRFVNERLVQLCKAANLKLIPGTWRDSLSSETETYNRLSSLGTDGFVMNQP